MGGRKKVIFIRRSCVPPWAGLGHAGEISLTWPGIALVFPQTSLVFQAGGGGWEREVEAFLLRLLSSEPSHGKVGDNGWMEA